MAAGLSYNMNPLETIKEYCNVETIFRRTGGFTLDTTNLVPGAILPPLAPLSLNFSTRKAVVVKNVKVYENALANATAIKVSKGSFAYVGMYLGDGNKVAPVTAIDTTNAAYDLLTISLGAAVTAGQVLFETTEPVATGAAEVKGIYTATITTNPTAGDKIKFNDIEIEFASAPAEGKAVVGATAAATAANLDDVLDEYTELTDLYEISYKGAKIVFKEKVGGTGVPEMTVTPVESTGTLAATMATTTEGVAAVTTANVPKNVCNGLLYNWNKKVVAGESITAIGAVMEINESKLVAPVSVPDKASLGARYDFI